MDKEFIKKLLLIAAVLAAVLIFYFIASPLQNCLRFADGSRHETFTCYRLAGW